MNSEILRYVLIVVITMIIAVIFQLKTHLVITECCFKLYKVKYIGFLFRAFQGKSPSTHGLIFPMLYIQAQGYIIGILNICFALINSYFYLVDYKFVFTTLVWSAMYQYVSAGIIIVITEMISKKREKMPKYQAKIKREKKRLNKFYKYQTSKLC